MARRGAGMAAGDGGRGRDLGAAALSVARVEAGQACGLRGVALTAQGWRKKLAGRVGGWQAARRRATMGYGKINKKGQENCRKKSRKTIRGNRKNNKENINTTRKQQKTIRK